MGCAKAAAGDAEDLSEIGCAPFHLYRYLDEQVFRFNERKDENGDQGRFLNLTKTTVGRRLKWKGLTQN